MADVPFETGGIDANIVGEISQNKAEVTAAGALMVDASASSAGSVKIEGDTSGNKAEVTASGELKTINTVSTPPAATEVSQISYTSMTGTSDTLYTITSGDTLTLQRLAAGGEGNGGVIELYEDPNGDLSVLNIVAAIFVAQSSDQVDLEEVFSGDGTRRILLRRITLGGGGARLMFGRWEGYEQ